MTKEGRLEDFKMKDELHFGHFKMKVVYKTYKPYFLRFRQRVTESIPKIRHASSMDLLEASTRRIWVLSSSSMVTRIARGRAGALKA